MVVQISPWSDAQCKQLEPVWQLAKARRDAHYSAHNYYNKWHNFVTLPSVLIGAVLSTISFDKDAAPAAVSASLAIFMTLMSTINSYFNFSKKQESHRQTYRGFNLLVRDLELSILRGQETPKREFVDFLEYINDNLTQLIENAQLLNSSSRKILSIANTDKPSPFDNLRGIDNEIDNNNQGLSEDIPLAVEQ